MWLARIRRIGAALAAALVLSLLAPASPGWARPASDMTDNPANEEISPPAFDLLVLRPIGIVAAGLGTLLFVAPVTPIVLITRPHEIGKPFHLLVVRPVRYVVADPLGHH